LLQLNDEDNANNLNLLTCKEEKNLDIQSIPTVAKSIWEHIANRKDNPEEENLILEVQGVFFLFQINVA
jgi:hypothetical protein